MTDSPSSGLTEFSCEEVKLFCVIGAGTVGAQIALLIALNGYNVYLTDSSPTALEKAPDNNFSQLQARVKKGKLTATEAEVALARIKIIASLEEAAAPADFVIEAIQEDLEVKQHLFGRLDKICRPQTILASNSAHIAIAKIAQQVEHKERVCNMHFFHPALVMQLVEVARGSETSEATIELVTELGHHLGKEVVIIQKEIFGFVAGQANPLEEWETNWNWKPLEVGYPARWSSENADKNIKVGLSHPMAFFEPSETIAPKVTRFVNKPTDDPRDRPPAFLDDLVREKKSWSLNGA